MLYQVKSYLKFLIGSSNAHGVHSPFVYDLITRCFYDKSTYSEYEQLQAYRKNLISLKETIQVTDFGKGSRVFKSNERRVAQIAKHAGIPLRRQKLLFRLTRYFSSEKLLELGTSVGLATTSLALGSPKGNVTTIEGCPKTSEVAQKLFDQFQLNHIQLHTTTFETFFDSNHDASFDLVYIDGNHSKENTLQYFHALLPLITNDSVLIFDDIYWSPEMTEAWEEVYANERVTISIDSFHWGLVFFRKEQPKQHFKIRL